MRWVYAYTFCLALGLLFSQLRDLSSLRPYLVMIADTCLGYIMMEVGLELFINKRKWKSYLKDYAIAFSAATLPWLLCFFYFFYFFSENTWEETLFISRYSAPTSSGILFSMLSAAGLATTWLFRKVQILAILDDVDTILLLIPLQFLMKGTRLILLTIIVMVIVLIFLAWRYLHRLHLPSGRIWLFIYSLGLSIFIFYLNHSLNIETEILLPAFVLGCLLHNPHDPRHVKGHFHEHAYIEPEERKLRYFDRGLKAFFMILVGALMPKIAFNTFHVATLIWNVLVTTILINLGKCVPLFCYRKEATLRQRAAVCFSMFPRGEVGAGILILAIEHGAGGYSTTVAGLSLILNLLLTGVFITVAVRLVKHKSFF